MNSTAIGHSAGSVFDDDYHDLVLGVSVREDAVDIGELAAIRRALSKEQGGSTDPRTARVPTRKKASKPA